MNRRSFLAAIPLPAFALRRILFNRNRVILPYNPNPQAQLDRMTALGRMGYKEGVVQTHPHPDAWHRWLWLDDAQMPAVFGDLKPGPDFTSKILSGD